MVYSLFLNKITLNTGEEGSLILLACAILTFSNIELSEANEKRLKNKEDSNKNIS